MAEWGRDPRGLSGQSGLQSWRTGRWKTGRMLDGEKEKGKKGQRERGRTQSEGRKEELRFILADSQEP